VSEPTPPEVGRWVGMGEALGRLALAATATAVGVGAIGAIVAAATGHGVAGGIAAAYYLVGCILFLVGMFPTGGFSMIRGTMTQRKPMGSRQEPTLLIGLVLIGLGIVIDVTRPF
jgi:hypothetical protein